MDDLQRAGEFMPEPRVLWVHGTPAKCVTGFTEQQMLAAITAALRAAPECPEGFVMVPVEATDEMLSKAAWEIPGRWRDGSPVCWDDIRDLWDAMTAARPQGVKG